MARVASSCGSELNLPPSSRTVRVKAVDTTTHMVCDTRAFLQPPIRGHEKLNLKTLCFLMEHEASTGSEYILFDCGSRKDFWNGSPQTQRMIGGHLCSINIEKSVDEVLIDSEAIVWSHWHWDHIGDGSRFPSTTDIVVGPGFTAKFVPGWPKNPKSFVLESDIRGHRIHEPEFNMMVAGFAAHDYFGDGSFYLLNVPGHALGHICGLARTTPDTFVFMGGDCCHYAGAFRPTPHLPLPSFIPAEQLDDYYPVPCPCSAFTLHHPSSTGDGDDISASSRTSPFYKISQTSESAYSFGDVAQLSVDKLQLLDAHPGIFICLAHDGVLFDLLPLFNNAPHKDINDWKHQNMKERSRWAFLNELPKGGQPGRKELLSGLWRDGALITWTEELGFVDAERCKI